MRLKIGNSNKNNRERWLKNKLASIHTGLKILDAGAGELQYKKYCKHLEYVAQDFGEYDGVGNNEGLQRQKFDNSKLDIKSDIASIPVDDKSFDAIMCIEVFEHIPEPINAIKEFSRILKKDGDLIITAPFCSLTHYAPYFFYTGFSKYWYEKFLKENGFKIIEIIPNGNYFEYLAQEIRRLNVVASRFTIDNLFLNLVIKSIKLPILLLLLILNKFDNNSSDLLCYGWQVHARKI